MFRILLHEPAWLYGALVILIWMAIFSLLLWVVRRRPMPVWLDAHKELIGLVYSIIGLFYSMLFAFVLVGVWEDYEEAEHNVYETAGALTELLSYGPETNEQQLQSGISSYVHWATREWETEDYSSVRNGLSQAMNDLKQAASGLLDNPDTKEPVHALIVHLHTLGQERISMNNSHIPLLIWNILLVGFVVCVLFLLLFKVDKVQLHLLLIISLTLVICLNLEIVYLLDHPFSGSTSISPAPLVSILNR